MFSEAGCAMSLAEKVIEGGNLPPFDDWSMETDEKGFDVYYKYCHTLPQCLSECPAALRSRTPHTH